MAWLIALGASVHVLRQKCCCVGLKGSALGVAGDGMFYTIYAPYYLSKIPKFLNSETYTVQAFSVKGIEPVLRATVSCNQRTITFWVFQGQPLFTLTYRQSVITDKAPFTREGGPLGYGHHNGHPLNSG